MNYYKEVDSQHFLNEINRSLEFSYQKVGLVKLQMSGFTMNADIQVMIHKINRSNKATFDAP
ncbi:hypothetical protein GXP67_35015 [Rhodocytophaga rosea]|uniref:Uncharacterized protein n=1 Tax=Rhodocytophaga rosea TaxID=2704465 RepID=A0A6C0GUM0_9BACT|nr:hypothetical protein [Rhodocytophaga rosea]QHT71504.1 hypothetical protein GXP67_35015 [Rhodocytophaga rosea]